MHPRSYVETFQRYEASNEVFVAMPFTQEFGQTFENIFVPAISAVQVHGRPLKPRVINRGTHGAPDIQAAIYDAILHSRVVIADVTVQACVGAGTTDARWQPNANVMYEVGLAAAWRNPEDVLLIHQPHVGHRYSFDIQNLRHLSYDPSNIPAAIEALKSEIMEALRSSIFLHRQSAEKIARMITPTAVNFMFRESKRTYPCISFTKPDAEGLPSINMAAIDQLIALGALRLRNRIAPSDGKGVGLVYEWTELGLSILRGWAVITDEQRAKMQQDMNSVPVDAMPPNHMLQLPATVTTEPAVEQTTSAAPQRQ